MVNYWAIAIGVNQYEHFQPLAYAERDAQAMQHFWAMEGGVPVENCWLFTDHVNPSGPNHLLPSRDGIVDVLTEVCQRRLGAEDVLWLFFSGYGAQYQGKDYLLPVDADPERMPATAIAVEDVLHILQAAPTRNILMLLDMNRSQGTLGGEGAGRQSLQLAQDLQQAVILSCRPEQFSHETLLLRQGLFTSVVLEGLRNYGCLTPDQLVQFLRDRLPELSEHHWRPRQDPVAIIPDHLRYQLMLPGKAQPPTPQPEFPDNKLPGDNNGSLQPPPEPPGVVAPPEGGNGNQEPPEGEDEQAWQKLIRLGGLTLLALLALVVVRNVETVIRPLPIQPNTGGDPGGLLPAPAGGENPGSLPPPPTELPTNPPVQPTTLPANPGEVPQNPELPAVGSSGEGGTGSNGNLTALERDRQLLDNARATLSRFRSDAPTNQVSEIRDAIQQLRQIPPDNPIYGEVQQSLDRWSGMILDIAVGRAARHNGGDSLVAARNYQSAIAAAQLVPSDRPEFFDAARRSITVWSQNTMDLANLHASEGAVALAIDVARFVPPDTPAYAEAQRAIATWQAQTGPKSTATQQTAEVAQ